MRSLYYMIYRNIRNAKSHIKWAWQRVFRGYDDCAQWNLSHYIAQISGPILRKMQKKGLSCPMDLTIKEWHTILDKIAYAMEHIDDDYYCRVKGENNVKEHAIKIEEGLDLFSKYFRDLWD